LYNKKDQLSLVLIKVFAWFEYHFFKNFAPRILAVGRSVWSHPLKLKGRGVFINRFATTFVLS
jgi:hypothetical protein